MLYDRFFLGKPLKSFHIYHDPFGLKEICIELVFVGGEVEFLTVGSGAPELLSSHECRESGSAETNTLDRQNNGLGADPT
ncbi:MAG TPA: hypothetical protein VFO40_26565 [Chthoniobacterales bacterium]|nr:hypothetical protein [Chthoniobacterales bacterium]